MRLAIINQKHVNLHIFGMTISNIKLTVNGHFVGEIVLPFFWKITFGVSLSMHEQLTFLTLSQDFLTPGWTFCHLLRMWWMWQISGMCHVSQMFGLEDARKKCKHVSPSTNNTLFVRLIINKTPLANKGKVYSLFLSIWTVGDNFDRIEFFLHTQTNYALKLFFETNTLNHSCLDTE